MISWLMDFIKSIFFGINTFDRYDYDDTHDTIVMSYTHRSFFAFTEEKRNAIPIVYNIGSQIKSSPVISVSEILLSRINSPFANRTALLSLGLDWEDTSSLKKVFFTNKEMVFSEFLYALTLLDLTLFLLHNKYESLHLTTDMSNLLSDNYAKATLLLNEIANLIKIIPSKNKSTSFSALSTMYFLSLTKKFNQSYDAQDPRLNVQCSIDNLYLDKTTVVAEIKNMHDPVKVQYVISRLSHSVIFNNTDLNKDDHETIMARLVWLLVTADDVLFALFDYDKEFKHLEESSTNINKAVRDDAYFDSHPA